jgi:hypothetical protein
MSISFWGDKNDDGAWNNLILGGCLWPGIATVTIEKSRDIDQAKSKGKDGITLTDNGFNAAKIDISIKLFEEWHWLAIQNVLPNFDPKITGGTKTPVDIIHPTTSLSGIKYIYIQKINIGNPENGVLTITIEAIEWFPATKATSTTKKPKGLNGTDKNGGSFDNFNVQPAAPSLGGAGDNF